MLVCETSVPSAACHAGDAQHMFRRCPINGRGEEGWERDTHFKYLATDLKLYKVAHMLRWGLKIPIISSVHI